ncbi:MAG: cytochrome c [Rhodospirillaceae bacterium]|nr:cytochrome c [Rhodospirillaceae bacterium]
MDRFCAALVAAGIVVLIAGTAAAERPLERGTYLVHSIAACGNCHTQQGPDGPTGPELAGGNPIEEPGAFVARPANITPDPETGIGAWTDAQLAKAIREGIRPDGSLIGPPMPFEVYNRLSDSDVAAIIAYLRTVQPVHNVVPKSEYKIPLPPAYGPPVGSVPDVPRADKLAYGAYLAGPLGHCVVCHTPMIEGRPDFEHALGAGGVKFYGPWGVSVSRNLTPDPESGLGAWSDAEIKRAISEGVSRDGTRLQPPMAFHWYRNISDEDLDAIVAYLRSLKPIRNEN